jgi:hypothetical protein
MLKMSTRSLKSAKSTWEKLFHIHYYNQTNAKPQPKPKTNPKKQPEKSVCTQDNPTASNKK